jgi:hypothetical protein
MNRIAPKIREEAGILTIQIRPDRYQRLQAMAGNGGRDIQTFIKNPGILTCPVCPCANEDGLSCKRGVEESCAAAFYQFIFREDAKQ